MDSQQVIDQLLSSNKFVSQETNRDLDQLTLILENIVKTNNSNNKVIYLIGGVASGKSTLANALAAKLSNTVVLSTDDYVINTREWRRTEIVAKGKSPLLKYDQELFRKNVAELSKDPYTPVFLPKYDEFSGLAVAAAIEKYSKVERKPDYVIVEGDFMFLTDDGLKIYLHASDELRANNRIERDRLKRNEIDVDKLKLDIKTRDEQQHFPFTLPNAENSDILVVINKIEDTYKYDLYIKNKI